VSYAVDVDVSCSVDTIWVHPQHSSATDANDVAVLLLTEDFAIDPIILNPNANSESGGQSQTIAVWGDTEIGGDIAM
jgi:hypothetical protein